MPFPLSGGECGRREGKERKRLKMVKVAGDWEREKGERPVEELFV